MQTLPCLKLNHYTLLIKRINTSVCALFVEDSMPAVFASNRFSRPDFIVGSTCSCRVRESVPTTKIRWESCLHFNSECKCKKNSSQPFSVENKIYSSGACSWQSCRTKTLYETRSARALFMRLMHFQ